jgi:hypothetical protein
VGGGEGGLVRRVLISGLGAVRRVCVGDSQHERAM